MPLLISRTAACSAVASFCSTIAVDRAGVVAQDPAVAERVGHLGGQHGDAARPARACASTRPASVSPCSSGVSPAITTTTPSVVPAAARSGVERDPYGVPGAVLRLLHGEQRARAPARGCAAPTCSRPLPTTATRCCRLDVQRRRSSTWPIMLRPPTGCSTFISLDFIRVPLPAASTITAVRSRPRLRRSLGARHAARSGCWTVGRPAPRVGVEPTSLVRIQSAAGPADRPTGDRARRQPTHDRVVPAGCGATTDAPTYGCVGYGYVG